MMLGHCNHDALYWDIRTYRDFIVGGREVNVLLFIVPVLCSMVISTPCSNQGPVA